MDAFSFPDGILDAFRHHADWRNRWEPFQDDPSLAVDSERFRSAFSELAGRLRDTYPFFHPAYAGQMLKPAHPVALAGYFLAQLMNPNNHALDGGPATGALEKEAVSELAASFGYSEYLGHLTSSGTIANLEALWVSRELRPGTAVAYSSQSHYTHARMCNVLGVDGREVASDRRGRMDLDALRALCRSTTIGTVVVTIGTTGLGALDPLPAILALRDEFGFRVHADAAYGGMYHVLAKEDPACIEREPFLSLPGCDSIVVDPHKHGLQPYGCGCVLFSDPSIGALYKHDSPYTYFTSTELHLGEISLECSRAGAAAAALWLTLKCFPLSERAGFGPILRKCREAALSWARMLRASEKLSLLLDPELDIVAFFPREGDTTASGISERSELLFRRAMEAPSPSYLSKLRVPSAMLSFADGEFTADREWTTILRSALMKPEHASHVERLHAMLESLL